MTRVAGGVTAPAGFLAVGIACGVKKRGKDLALIFSEGPAVAAGTLTRNALRASCVDWAAKVLRHGSARAIVAVSGNANCCTGRRGAADTQAMARWTAEALKIRSTEVLVASTGVIGQPLPMPRIRKGIEQAANKITRTGSHLAAEAILTTDTRLKEFALRIAGPGHPITIGGIAKGSGMVAPNMAPPPAGGGVATMLCFLTTDARVDRTTLQRLIRRAVEESFNRIRVDGQTSTNDMVLILANGRSGAAPLKPGSKPYRMLEQGLNTVCRVLAHEIVRDGEGVTRVMKVQVAGAASAQEARQVASSIADSMLVKTMVAGRDPNWGRVAAAVGASGCRIDPKRLAIRLGKVTVFRNGEPARLSRPTLLEQVDHPEVQIGVDLGIGSGRAQLLSGDLTEEYVRINAKYTS